MAIEDTAVLVHRAGRVRPERMVRSAGSAVHGPAGRPGASGDSQRPQPPTTATPVARRAISASWSGSVVSWPRLMTLFVPW
jgi:hypothetical protein